MLNQSDILERIDSGKTKIINKFVGVQYDSKIQLPIDFWFLDQHHEILEVISQKKSGRFSSSFLVRTDKGIYNLNFYYLEINLSNFQLTLNGRWKIVFQVIE